MKEALRRILEAGVIPVIRVPSSREAMDAALALKNGGLTVLEITMTVPDAVEVVRDAVRQFGGHVLIGAGTVLDAEGARKVLDAGAGFVVSPVLDPDVIRVAQEGGAVAVPGALTPTEILAAWRAGADLVKVFPISSVGGPAYIKALKGPLPHIPLVPTGGVGLRNVGDYIRAGAAAVAAGGELIDKKALSEGNFSVITETAQKFLKEVESARSMPQ